MNTNDAIYAAAWGASFVYHKHKLREEYPDLESERLRLSAATRAETDAKHAVKMRTEYHRAKDEANED